jgi:hypothetical protein
MKNPLREASARRWIISGVAFVLGTCAVGGWIQANVQEWAKATGQDQYLVMLAQYFAEPGSAITAVAAIVRSDWFVGSALFSTGFAIALWVEYLFRRRATGTSVAAPQVAKRALTADQIQCRISLKQFSLIWPARILDEVTRVRAAIIVDIKGSGDRDFSYALFHALHFAYSAGSKSLEQVKCHASLELDRIDIEALQHSLRVFFDDYVWEQRLVANLGKLVGYNIGDHHLTQKWLAADRECWAELAKQTVWPETAKLKKITADKMASNTDNWTTPFRVNF